MNTSQTAYRMNGIPLDPQRVNGDFLKSMRKAAAGTAVEGNETAAKTLDTFTKQGEIEGESVEQLDSFTRSVNDQFKTDKDRFWEHWRSNGRNFRDPDLKAIEKEMGVSGEYLIHEKKLTTELREATARTAVEALAGGSFGPTGVVSGYAAYANGTTWSAAAERRTAALIGQMKELQSGDSSMTTEGNRVQQVHRAELWKSMNGLMDHAVEKGKAGEPVDLTLQYYELTSSDMIGRMAQAAKSGSKLRLNMDAGRLSFPAKDSKTQKNYYEVDDIPHKMRTALQFLNLEGADVGVSIYPVKAELNSPTDLMHRKIMRVGDTVLASGMNANMGSGGNIDAGYLIEGPAARDLTKNLARDLSVSAGASTEDIWGENHLKKFQEEDLRVGTRGLGALLDGITGPTPAGTPLPTFETRADLEKMAKSAGFELQALVDIPADEYEQTMDKVVSSGTRVSLSDKGKEALLGLIDRTVKETQSDKNVSALKDVTLPNGEAVGKTRVDIADQPVEREALILNAISEADEFIYLPGFVVTRAVAAAIVAKRDEAKAKGEEVDIRVVADSGIYPHGGTPNTWGVDFLEDNDIPVRWTKLTRTGSHDRKVHAKQLITDKGEVTGSTNFSNKGLKENWETSTYVHFDPADPQSEQLREETRSQFEQLWNEETYDLTGGALSSFRNRFAPKVGREWAVEQDRNRNTKEIIGLLESYEKATAGLVGSEMKKPEVKAHYESFLKAGYSETDAALKALEAHHGREEFLRMRQELPENQKLEELRSTVQEWQARNTKAPA